MCYGLHCSTLFWTETTARIFLLLHGLNNSYSFILKTHIFYKVNAEKWTILSFIKYWRLVYRWKREWTDFYCVRVDLWPSSPFFRMDGIKYWVLSIDICNEGVLYRMVLGVCFFLSWHVIRGCIQSCRIGAHWNSLVPKRNSLTVKHMSQLALKINKNNPLPVFVS